MYSGDDFESDEEGERLEDTIKGQNLDKYNVSLGAGADMDHTLHDTSRFGATEEPCEDSQEEFFNEFE